MTHLTKIFHIKMIIVSKSIYLVALINRVVRDVEALESRTRRTRLPRNDHRVWLYIPDA